MENNKIIVHACGGTGINLAYRVVSELEKFNEALPSFIYHHIDTTTSTSSKYKLKGDLFLIKDDTGNNRKIDGSGGERRDNASVIFRNIAEYLKDLKYTKPVTGEFHLVLMSASGGSGSSAGIALLEYLASKNIPAVAVVVGDSSDALKAKNTLNVLATLHHKAININKAISIMFLSNDRLSNSLSPIKREEIANDMLLKHLSVLATFLSNNNEELDTQDMVNFICPSNYTTIKIPAGLYGLYTSTKIDNLEEPTSSNVTLGRILTIQGQEAEISAKLIQYKVGYISNEKLITTFKDISPIYLYSIANILSDEEKTLQSVINHLNERVDNIRNNSIEACNEAKIDPDTGMFL